MNDEIVIHQEELNDAPKKAPKPPKRRRTWPHWRRALKWLGFTILFAIIAIAAYLFFTLSKISVNPFGFGHLKGEDRGRVNIMMLGVGDPGHDGENLSDTNILLSVDTVNHKIAVISIPRDTQVDIPGYGESKINNANAQGGVKTAKTVFEDTLGQPVDYYVKANFTGLKDVVDAVGGIDITNTDYLSDTEYPCDKNQYKSCGFVLKPGQYHMDGATALKYVRCRKGTCGDDFGRAARQQQVMDAIRAKATSGGTLANPVALGKLINAAGNNIDTDLSVSNMLRLNELTKQVDKNNIFNIVFSLKPDGFLVASKTTSNLLPADGTFADIKAFVKDIFKLGPIWSEHPTVIVENGTTTPGLGATFAKQVESSDYSIDITAVMNALTRDHATSQVIDYTGGKKPHTASYLTGLLKIQSTTPPPANVATPPADFVVILGTDYANAQKPASTSGSTTTTTGQ